MMKVFTVSSFLAEIELMEITYLFAFHFKDISEYYKLILKLSTLDVATSVVSRSESNETKPPLISTQIQILRDATRSQQLHCTREQHTVS